MADTPEMSENDRKRLVESMLCELAKQANQAAEVTQDPRIQAIAAVAQEQVKNTAAFSELLAGYGRASPTSSSAGPSTVQAVFQQAQLAAMQQNERWASILEESRVRQAGIEAEIADLTQQAINSLKQRNTHYDGSASRTSNPASGTPNAAVVPAAETGSLPVQ